MSLSFIGNFGNSIKLLNATARFNSIHCNLKAKSYLGLNHEGLEGTVLATIINKKVLDVKEIVLKGQRTAPLRSLSKALENKGGRNFILECKQSSPTLGDFCKDFLAER